MRSHLVSIYIYKKETFNSLSLRQLTKLNWHLIRRRSSYKSFI